MRSRAALAVIILSTTACGATTPVWYEAEPGKSQWTLPLLDPLADAALLVPAFVNGKGPYTFVLDPEAPASMIDRGVAEDIGLYRGGYIRLVNQRDVTVPRRTYEILSLEVGDLRARNFGVAAAPAGTLRAAGRPVHGVIGPDLLSRTIVLDVDRDAGVVRLVLTGHARVPEGAVRVGGGLHLGTLRVGATANDSAQVDLVVHVARRTTSLRSEIIGQLGLSLAAGQETIVDATGDAITVNGRTRLATLRLGDLTVSGVDVIPYEDRRGTTDIDYHGVLGQNVLARYRAVIDRDHEEVWLAPRAGDLSAGARERLRRWGAAFDACELPGCTRLAFDSATRTLELTREAGGPARLGVVVQALDEAGAPVGPLLRAELADAPVALREPGTVAEYAGAAAFRVVDAAPVVAGAIAR